MTTEHLEDALPGDLLPTLPAAAHKALELVGTTNADLGELSVLIGGDELIAARLLQAVNTGRVNEEDQCTSLEEAIEKLGLNTVRLLVVAFSLVDLTRGVSKDLDLTEFWRRCVYAASASRRLATISGSGDPEVAFMAGLLQDIGMLTMLSSLGDRYREVLIQAKGSHIDLPRVEQAAVGFTHADAGAHLGAHWGLDTLLVAPIRLHHQSGTALQGCSREVAVAAMASRMSANEDLKSVMAMSKALFGLSPEQTRSLMQKTARDSKGLSGLLHLRKKPKLKPKPVPVDLRQQFAQVLSQQFKRAVAGDGILGLIIGEADAMDTLLTRFGANATRRTLAAVYERVERRSGTEPLQLPGGRFAVILPGATRSDTSVIAERLRHDIAGTPFDVRDDEGKVESLSISLSAGTAALEPAVAQRISRAEDLWRVAENALKAAVSAGRDCVRVFTPRVSDDRSHAA